MKALSTWTISCYSKDQIKLEIEKLQARVDLCEQLDKLTDFDKHTLLWCKKKIETYNKWLELDRSIIYVAQSGIKQYILNANELNCTDVETGSIHYIQF